MPPIIARKQYKPPRLLHTNAIHRLYVAMYINISALVGGGHASDCRLATHIRTNNTFTRHRIKNSNLCNFNLKNKFI